MSFMDFAEAFPAAHGKEFDWFKGSCQVTVGDALAGFYGGRQTHILGPDIKLVCDLEDMLVTHGLGRLLPGLSELLAGIGGNVSFCYGSNVSATYIGPKIDIRRGEEIKKIGASLTKKNETTNLVAKEDAAIAKIVLILSVIMLLVTWATELGLHFAYPEFGSKDDDSEERHHGIPPQMLKLLSIGLTSRLMEFIKQIETVKSRADLGQEYLKSAKRLGLIPAAPFLILGGLVGALMLLTVMIPKTEAVTWWVALAGVGLMEKCVDGGKYLAAVE